MSTKLAIRKKPYKNQRQIMVFTIQSFFVAVCGMFQRLQDIAKTVVLLHEEHFCEACVRTPTCIDKCGFEASKTLSRPPKIEFAATPNPEKTTNVTQKSRRSAPEATWCEKMAPRKEKCANMGPTCVSFGLHFGSLGPPLVRTCSMLMQAKNAVGFNTPGAASSAAD